MISTMENGGGLIEPKNEYVLGNYPAKITRDEWAIKLLNCVDCPWKHPETCKVCKEEKHGKND